MKLRIRFRRLYQMIAMIFCGAFSTLSAQNDFQQVVNYQIQVTLDPDKKTLTGNIDIEYLNQSPDTLNEIYMHLWPNAYKNTKTALAQQLRENKKATLEYAKAISRGFINQLNFKVNDKEVTWSTDKKHIDIALITLNEPLLPKQKIQISTPFFVKIPDARISRLGYYKESFMITQWYPKPAVYDAYGWHPMPYLDQGEFYSEFGSFEVSITLPSDYVVAATGNLQTAEEKEFLEKRIAQTHQYLTGSIDSFLKKPKSTEKKTVVFKQDKVHDFAWFASREFLVQKSSVNIGNTNKPVETFAFFSPRNSKIWDKTGVEAVNKSVDFYSKMIGSYPYDVCTAVDGIISAGGGMEYPTITVIGGMGSKASLEEVIAHEVGHNWFYGILASNEREHPWMDEGLNSYYDQLYTKMVMKDSGGILPKIPIFGLKKISEPDNNYLPFLFLKRRGLFQPIGDAAYKQKSINYGLGVYMMTAQNLRYLHEYLGAEVFDAAMRDYYQKYSFKHPQPSDLQKVFETQSGKDLNWFFDGLILRNEKVDYAVIKSKSKKSGDKLFLQVKNKGKVAAPFQFGQKGENHPWIEGFVGKKEIEIADLPDRNSKIDPEEWIPEDNRKNNYYKARPLKIQFLTAIEDPGRKQIFVTPVLFGNKYNGVIAGAAFHNIGIIRKKFEYLVMPTYAIGNQMFTGKGFLNYYINPTGGKISEILLGLDLSRFTSNNPYWLNSVYKNFTRLVPSVKVTFRNQSMRSVVDKSLRFRSILINHDYKRYKANGTPTNNIPSDQFYMVNEFSFRFENPRMLNPYEFRTNLEIISSKEFNSNAFSWATNVKLSAEYQQLISYFRPNQGLDIRVFGGVFLTSNQSSLDTRFRMSGYSGWQDYRYDYPFLGRGQAFDFFSHQFIEAEGGVKSRTYSLDSWSMMFAANFKASLAPRVPIKLYADIGVSRVEIFYPGSVTSEFKFRHIFSAGIMVYLWRGAFEVYIPLGISGDYYPSEKYLMRDVRFVFDLSKINYKNISRKIKIM